MMRGRKTDSASKPPFSAFASLIPRSDFNGVAAVVNSHSDVQEDSPDIGPKLNIRKLPKSQIQLSDIEKLGL